MFSPVPRGDVPCGIDREWCRFHQPGQGEDEPGCTVPRQQGQDQEATAPGAHFRSEVPDARVWQAESWSRGVASMKLFYRTGQALASTGSGAHRLAEIFGSRRTLVDLFKYPTVSILVQLRTNEEHQRQRHRTRCGTSTDRSRYRVPGQYRIARSWHGCRFPGAGTAEFGVISPRNRNRLRSVTNRNHRVQGLTRGVWRAIRHS